MSGPEFNPMNDEPIDREEYEKAMAQEGTHMNGPEGVFQIIFAAISQANCKVVKSVGREFRCFIVDREAFLKVWSYIFVSGREVTSEPMIAAEGYENFEVSIGLLDKNQYWLCAKMEPILDSLWEKKK